jgi:flagellar FliJ protein
VLTLRTQQEQIVQKELSALQKELDEAFNVLKSLDKERLSVEQELTDTQRKSHVATRLVEHLQYLDLLKKKIAYSQDDVIKLQNKIASKRQKLFEAKKNKEVLEKLKEKHYSDWKNHIDKIESQFLDELATIRFHRQDSGLKYD